MASSSSLRALAIWVAVMVGAMAGPAFAQTGAASVTGLITDESGAPVPGVTITATNQATNVTYTAVSNEAGNYTIAALPIGTYVVKAELTGFRTLTRTPTTFEAQQIARLDFRMSVGQIQESVEVSGTPPILQTETATVGEVISGNTAQSLPLNGRNIGQLALTLPGTVTYNPRGFTNIGSVNMNRPFVNGNREQTNNFTVDGLDVNESIDNRVAYQPIPDAVAEISVETNNYAADMGNVGGAVVSSVIKSGSEPAARQRLRVLPQQRLRRQHVGEQLRQRAEAGAQAAHLRRHDWRTARQEQPVLLRRLPGLAPGCARVRHDLGGADGLARAAICRACRRRSSIRVSGQQFPGNRIPIERFGAPARALLSDTANYPLPNRDVPGGITSNYVGETLLADSRPPGRRPRRLEPVGQRQVLRPLLVRDLRRPARRPADPAGVHRPQRPAVPQRRLQLEPHLRADGDQRSADRVQPHHRDAGDLRLGGHRRRERPLRHRRRPADRRAELARLGQRPDAAGHERPRFGHGRRHVPDQREADLVEGPSHPQVRWSMAALQPAALLRRQQRPARLHQLQRRLHGLRLLGLPARPLVGQRAVAAATRRTRGRRSRTASPSSSRTTSS